MADEHRRDAMGCAGHPIVKTPHLDKLASRGTLFENAYTPSPMCVPARAALACGNYVHRLGYWDSAAPYDGRHASWMHRLRDDGVQITSIGKLHFRSKHDDNGFSEEILPMHVVDETGWTLGLLRKNPAEFTATAELAEDIGFGRSSYMDYDLSITDAAENWIASSEKTKIPWVLFVSLVSPHYPLIAPAEFEDLYPLDKMDMPVAYQTDQRPDHPELRNLSTFFDYDVHFNQDRVRAARASYYGLISFTDQCVGRLIRALEKTSHMERTTVIYTSDHGDMMGDHGFWTKQVMYEASVGIPLIGAGPGFPENHRCSTMATLLDIAPTAAALVNSTANTAASLLPGRSLVELASNPHDPDRSVFSEYHDGGSTTGIFMVRWDRWKYIHYEGFAPQLFDIEQDPFELTDLVGTTANQAEIADAIDEGNRRLREICNPAEVNRRCFADQARRIAELGGEDVCRRVGAFNHTPTPVG